MDLFLPLSLSHSHTHVHHLSLFPSPFPPPLAAQWHSLMDSASLSRSNLHRTAECVCAGGGGGGGQCYSSQIIFAVTKLMVMLAAKSTIQWQNCGNVTATKSTRQTKCCRNGADLRFLCQKSLLLLHICYKICNFRLPPPQEREREGQLCQSCKVDFVASKLAFL